jgi:hypothetical protein
MLRFIFRLLGLAIVVVLFIFLFLPSFLMKAGNGLLSGIGSVNASGSAQIVPQTQGNGGYLLINLQGLAAKVPYVITLDAGQCGGPVLKTFNSVTADSNGTISGALSFSNLALAVQKGIWVDVHAGRSATGPTVACGKVDINQFVTQSTPAPTPTFAPIPTTTAITINNTPATSGNGTTITGFPQTGVAPASNNWYDNYQFPRKY